MAAALKVQLRVELRSAPLPWPVGLLASHYWFVVFDGAKAQRWEVWQTKNAGGRAVGHVHCDLKPPDAGVGGGPMRVESEWTGEQAASIARVLENARTYPHCERYHYWPGPNSNTYASWVLRRAGIDHPLPRRAIGGRYPC
jgi:hypothetical protein